MKRVYIDANVLIAAFQGEEQIAQRALRVLDDPALKLVISDYLRLEVLPKPTFHMEKGSTTPQIGTVIKVLAPLGKKLAIVPIEQV